MVEISFGQAILLIIDYYKNQKNMDLKKLYLDGITSKNDLQLIQHLLKKTNLNQQYKISINAEIINEDPTRRYFETHLAFETLLTSIDKIDLDDLTLYYDALYKLIPQDDQIKFDNYLCGKVPAYDNLIANEYMDAFYKLASNKSYRAFSENEKNKLSLIFRCAWIGTLLAKLPEIPLNVYNVGFFSEQQRGRLIKVIEASAETHGKNFQVGYYSNHFGLMKSYMPVPKNDIIFTKKGFPFIRPPDRVNFDLNAAWPKQNFSSLVHPFSCSISGTMLCQIRCLKKLQENGQLPFHNSDKFIPFLQCFISSLLFNSGGHSFNEFLSVLKIPKIIEEFDFIDDFPKINIITLLFNNNELQFNSALNNTIVYTKAYLAKKQMHFELLERPQIN
ncbi:Uncharacterised protein [Legionella beliardensis]|uniref:Uncharacterized protein n=1 Tax=Legionella beliardensis TaxID=91822 RepID=A0A378I535_9GAMM|nr:hypothetical protein [Legionella beliardensis]STX29781.1 Uncharacterised protein [Legionella beliardensis]